MQGTQKNNFQIYLASTSDNGLIEILPEDLGL